MGYGTRPGSEIRTFWPDDDDETLYIPANWNSCEFNDLIDQIKNKWPDADMSQIRIEAQHIHTDCIGFDLYDPSDYTNFLVITRNK